MTLELRDVESVNYKATSIAVEISTTQKPDELEVELIDGWPVPVEGAVMHWDGKVVRVEVPSTEAAGAMVRWLISEQGLPAISARADVVRDETDRLLNGLRALVQQHYGQV